ncbi:MAG: 50S ribosomal protein L15 [Acidobacteria bacterium]|nr:50S ribosomal protein L15 [Acidobacteriota bacterium]
MTLSLNSLRRPRGAKREGKRVGRGPGSGWGKTAGRGSKGQKSRSGYAHRAGFEGGQMPLYRRLPKRGFKNIFRKDYAEINVQRLNRFEAGSIITPEALKEQKLIGRNCAGLRVLGNGKLDRALTVKAHHFTKGAQEKITGAGGSFEVIGA